MNEEARHKMSAAKKELWTREPHPWIGRHHSEETKAKIRASKAGKGKGSENPFFGKHHTQQTKEVLSNQRKGVQARGNNPRAIPVLCVETGVVYPCAKDASQQLGINHGSICAAAKGKLKTAGHFHWKYIKEDSYGIQKS